ncbi:MAG: tyrosine-type recombinase/integrase [Blastocatellia bacterium]|nr:tyrosine-type recombinase/integrase [Blastocatellia bacterium]
MPDASTGFRSCSHLSEVLRLLTRSSNLKYRTILVMIYATGMRSSEATHLLVSDIDSERNLITVRQGK